MEEEIFNDKLNDMVELLRMLNTTQNDIVEQAEDKDNVVMFAYPDAGGVQSIAAGTLKLNYVAGTITSPADAVTNMKYSLQSKGKKWIRSMSIWCSIPTIIQLDGDDKITVKPGRIQTISHQKCKLLTITTTDTTTLSIITSTSPETLVFQSPDSIYDDQELILVANETTSHTVNGSEFYTMLWKSAEYEFSCTSLTGTTPTLNVKVQGYDPNTETWFDIATFTELDTSGTQHINISEGLGWKQRVQYTTGGTVTDCDFKVGVVYKR